MLRKNLFIIWLFALASVFCSNIYAQQGESSTSAGTDEMKIGYVRKVSFHLKKEPVGIIFGKVIVNDGSLITLAKLDGSKIVVVSYGKREIDSKTLLLRKIPESKYCKELAEYFAGRTGDFKDDPDDFIQAIRYYEKAKRLLAQAHSQDSKEIQEVEAKIIELKRDRDVWEKEIKTRAQLKKLEFEDMYTEKMQELKDIIDRISQRQDNIIVSSKNDLIELTKDIADLERGFNRSLDRLAEDIYFNKVEFNDFRRNEYRNFNYRRRDLPGYLIYPRYPQRRAEPE